MIVIKIGFSVVVRGNLFQAARTKAATNVLVLMEVLDFYSKTLLIPIQYLQNLNYF